MYVEKLVSSDWLVKLVVLVSRVVVSTLVVIVVV